MAIIPHTQNFGDIELVEILVFFNEPIFFQGLSNKKVDLFCLLVSDENNINKWLVIEASKERTNQILSGDIDLFSCFSEAESGTAVIIEIDPRQNKIINEQSMFTSEMDNEMLPTRGLIFDGETLTNKLNYHSDVIYDNRLRLHLNFDKTPPGEAPVGMLGQILVSLQGLLESISQALFGATTERGSIPKSLLSLSNMNLDHISTGSTIVELVPSGDATLYNENAEIITEFLNLVNSSVDEDELTNKLKILKARVASSYLSFLSSMTTQTKPLIIEFSQLGCKEPIRGDINHENLSNAIEVIKRIEFSEPTILEMSGTLMGMNIEKRTFELHQTMGEGIGEVVGKIDEGLIEQLYGTQIGYKYKFKLRARTKARQFSDGVEEIYELIGLDAIPN